MKPPIPVTKPPMPPLDGARPGQGPDGLLGVAVGLGQRLLGHLPRRAERAAPLEAAVDEHLDQPVDGSWLGVHVIGGVERGAHPLRLGAARRELVEESHASETLGQARFAIPVVDRATARASRDELRRILGRVHRASTFPRCCSLSPTVDARERCKSRRTRSRVEEAVASGRLGRRGPQVWDRHSPEPMQRR